MMTIEAPTDPRVRRPGWQVIVTGAIAGTLWGVAARIWMRVISTRPEFSWSGTVFILLLATVSGSLVGSAVVARRWTGGPGRRRLASILSVASIVPIGMGQGAVMLPGIVFGAFSLPGRRPQRSASIVLGLLPLLALFATGIDPTSSLWWATLAGLVALGSILVVTGMAQRQLLALLTAVAVGVVVVPLFTGPLALWRAVLGSALYVALLIPVTLAYAKVVRGHHVGPPAPDLQTPSTTVGGDPFTKELP
jgi:hypothetical protein